MAILYVFYRLDLVPRIAKEQVAAFSGRATSTPPQQPSPLDKDSSPRPSGSAAMPSAQPERNATANNVSSTMISSIGMKLNWVQPLGVWVGETEVTQAEFEKIMGSNPSRYKGENRPVDKVSWDEAGSFCEKLTNLDRSAGKIGGNMSYRLPTNMEYDVYVDRAELADAVVSLTQHRRGTMEVRSGKANDFGLYDVRGNVSGMDFHREATRSSLGR